MKKLLDHKFFVGGLIAFQVLLLVAGILMAIYDDGHGAVALLILVIVFSVTVSLIIALLSLFLKSSKKWFYVGIFVFWLLPFFSLFAEFYEAYIFEAEYEDVLEQMQQDSMYVIDEELMEDEWIEEQDTILPDSIQ